MVEADPAAAVRVEAVAATDGAAASPTPRGIVLALEDVTTGAGRWLRASGRATTRGRLDAIGVRLHLPGADRLLGDGYHSWDWAGLRDLARPGAAWWGGIVGATGSTQFFTVRLARPPVVGAMHLRWDGGGALDLLTTGAPAQEWERTGRPTGLGSLAPGDVVAGDPVALSPFRAGDETGAALPTVDGLPRPGPREVGWMSWNCHGPTVTAATARAALSLVPPGGVVLVDDGWMERWGDWRVAPRFGSTLAHLAAALADHTVRLGCWLAPFLVDPSSTIVREHPQWLLREVDGTPCLDHRPARAQHVLDASQPEVRQHLTRTGALLARSGVAVLKADFLYAGAASGRRNEGWTGMRALRAGMEALLAGFDRGSGDARAVWLCGAPAPPLVGLGDACRSGADAVVAIPGFNEAPTRGAGFVHGLPIIRAQERNLAARAWLWGATLPPDVDAVSLGVLGDTPPVDDTTARRWLALAERAGGPLLNADVGLSSERNALLRSSQQRVAGRPPRATSMAFPLEGVPAPAEDDHFLSQPEG